MSSSGEGFNRAFRGGAADANRDRAVKEARQSLQRQSIPAYTVFNLHRFPLFVSLGDMGHIRVPARSADLPYGKTVIREPRFTMRDLGDNNFTPEPVFPELLAQEVVREYGETGGVFLAPGDSTPSAEQLAAAETAQFAWYRREYRKAVDAWYRYRQHKFITDRQRDAARELARRKEIPALPEWVDASQETADGKLCTQCGETVKAMAQICRYCRSSLAAPASRPPNDRHNRPLATRGALDGQRHS